MLKRPLYKHHDNNNILCTNTTCIQEYTFQKNTFDMKATIDHHFTNLVDKSQLLQLHIMGGEWSEWKF